jgi:hypothetical protein
VLTNVHNFQYFGKLWVGTQLQEMTFIFDTGSAWTWIPSQDCPLDECPNRRYEYKYSEGFRNTGITEEVVYGIGKINGYIVNDDISISSDKKF